MKKLISILIITALSFGTVSAQDYTSQSGEFGYSDDGTLNYYYGLQHVYIPSEIDGVKIEKIGEKAFFDLGIASVSMDYGIKEIGESAFEGCNIKSATIAESVVKIADKAFENCAELEDVYIFGTADTAFGKNAFAGTGHLTFYIYCNQNTEYFINKLTEAKGDSNFTIEALHETLLDVENEKDLFGENMLYCEACGFKGSRYFDDMSEPFDDVSSDDWYYKYVLFSYGMGIVNGKNETTFDPQGAMTCAEAAKIAATIHASQSLGIEITPSGDKWYSAYVNYCYEFGIIEDYITFDWEKEITRGEMAYLFSRCDVYPSYLNDVPITDIPDVYDTTPYAYEILDLYNKGVAVGDLDMSFHPDSTVKRCEAAAFISRIIGWGMRIELPKG